VQLFSSGLCQSGQNEEGLWGFLMPDIKKELGRGKRLVGLFSVHTVNVYIFTIPDIIEISRQLTN